MKLVADGAESNFKSTVETPKNREKKIQIPSLFFYIELVSNLSVMNNGKRRGNLGWKIEALKMR